MKTYLVKLLFSIFIICGICVTCPYAQVNTSDTTKLLASVLKNELKYTSSVIEANVKYPEILEKHTEQSLDYVEKFSDKKRAYILYTYKTGKKYFPKIVSVLKRYNLPEELKVLIALESGFSANAVSKAGAVGYWQIIDEVAKEYGLQILTAKDNSLSAAKDERKNFNKSTLVAARYLRDRKLNLNNDLLLMVASYNCGVGTVWNALKKCNKTKPTFWDIKNLLPAETRNYVMNFIALNVIFKNYENFVSRQLLFAPKTIENIAVETSNTIPVEGLEVD